MPYFDKQIVQLEKSFALQHFHPSLTSADFTWLDCSESQKILNYRVIFYFDNEAIDRKS